MAFGKTYLAGSKGLFRVYDHNTDVWNDYSGFTALDLFDVKTSQLPNFPDYAIICGDTYVGYTTNAGQTVTQVTVSSVNMAKAYQISIPESIAMQNPGIYIVGSAITGAVPAVIKSVDAGLTYTSVITGLTSTLGPIARSVYFTTVDIGIIGQGGGIAKTINGGTSWSYLNGGAVLAAGELVSGLCMSFDQQTIIAATDKKVYKSTNGGTSFSVVYTWADPTYYGAVPKYTNLAGYHPSYTLDTDSSLWVSAANGPIVYSSDMGSTWSEVFPNGDLLDARLIFGESFYSATEGFFTYDLGGDSLGLVYKATDASTTMVTTSSTDYFATGSVGYSLWSTQVTPGCGCPPGFTLDPVAKTCNQSYFACPDGFTWNPTTEECEGAETPCLLDLVIAIDRSSSISATEMVNYKTFIQAIIDAIQDTAGGNARITDGTVRVGIVFWGNASPINFGTNQGNLPLQVGPVSIVSNNVWGPGTGVGTLKSKIDSMQVPPSNAGQGTNYFAGLAAAYGTLATGATNARPSAKKKILWITDGWPNTSNPPLTLNGYVQPTNYLDNACTGADGTPGSSNLNAPLNCCHGATDVIPTNPNNPINTSPYTIAKRLMYTQAMNLAQDIKNGNVGGVGASTPMPITAIIVGTEIQGGQSDRATTRDALVGPVDPSTGIPLTGPGNYCSFDVNAFVNPTVTASTSPPVSFPYWNASYPVDSPPGSGNWLRFPSNNAAGTADYFNTEFNFDPAIIQGIKTSLLCTITEPPMVCPEPCVLNTTTGNCDCVSSDLFVPCCYTLTNCDTGLVEYSVNTFGLSNDYLNSLQGQILKITGLDECLYVNITFECTNSTEISIDAVEQAFETCEDCKKYIAQPPCYLLTNCNNTDITLLSTQNLSTFSGKVVELNDYPGLCWTVLKTSNCPGPFTTVGIVESYDDCECCFQYQCK